MAKELDNGHWNLKEGKSGCKAKHTNQNDAGPRHPQSI